ncbi:MAG: ferredoxin, partial [Oscillospiraceae bacterium]|nr:ferredoxin [Oscillospiraceae bacterium]
MFVNSKTAEQSAILNLAYSVCAAARTAPKACGIDHIETAVLTGEDKDRVTAEMRRLGESYGEAGKFFCRDADNADASGAVVLVGAKYETRGLGAKCKLCGFENCSACEKAGAACVFTAMDLGIALGSAVSMIA